MLSCLTNITTVPKTAKNGSSKKNTSTPAKSAGETSKAQTVGKITAAYSRNNPPPAPKKRTTANSREANFSGSLPTTTRKKPEKLPALRLEPVNPLGPAPEVELPMADKTKMPNPQSRDAPSFDADKPEELLRFINRMEDLYKKHGIDNAKDKIEMLGKYADARSENEWRYLKTYNGNDFTKFKKELINSYPEAADQEHGSLKKLARLCKEYRGLEQTDLNDLQALVRGLKAEVAKLQTPPALLSNREAVEQFLGCLDDEFRNNVLSRLEILTIDDEDTVRAEDRFQLDDVIDTALSIGQGSRSTYKSNSSRAGVGASAGAVRGSSRASSSDAAVKVEAELSHLKDSFIVQNRQSEAGLKQLNSKIEELTRLMTQSRVMSQNASVPPPRFNVPDPRSRLSGNCFYCNDPGHMKTECPHKADHLLKGWISIDALGRVKMADGRPIPWSKPGDSVKERIESVYADGKVNVNVGVRQRTPGIIQLNQNMVSSIQSAHVNQGMATQEDVERLLDQLDLNDVQQYVYGRVQNFSESENF